MAARNPLITGRFHPPPDSLGKRLPIGNGALVLIRLPGLADGGMEVRPFLGVVLGFEEVADGAEVMGVALAGLGWQDVALHPRLHLRLHLR